MNTEQITVAALLDAARNIAAQERFDVEEMSMLLANIPMDDLDTQTRGAVVHARHVAAAERNITNSSHTAMTRYALARVTVLLERRVMTLVFERKIDVDREVVEC